MSVFQVLVSQCMYVRFVEDLTQQIEIPILLFDTTDMVKFVSKQHQNLFYLGRVANA